MKSFKSLVLVTALAFVGLARPASAQTQGLDVQVTVLGHAGDVAGSPSDQFLTFNAPVEVPGVALAPGAYIFRFIAPSVMQVMDQNRSTIYAMFQVTPTWRNQVTGEYAVTLRRDRTDAPAKVEALFLPNDSTGYEFTYPRERSRG